MGEQIKEAGDGQELMYESLMNDVLFHMVFTRNMTALRGAGQQSPRPS